MNYLTLKTGQALYVPADGIHAWFQGDIVECMARSDNVLNVGFCPRADRDNIELFTETLNFRASKAEEALLEAVECVRGKRGKTREFKPELSEFNVLVTRLEGGEREEVEEVKGPSVLMATKGAGKMEVRGGADGDEGKEVRLEEGWVFFVRYGVEVGFEADGEDGLEVFRAYAE